ncbi:MAG: helix-turn-helix transcriptional regulator [Candidatus Methylacidiphilales bacterium]|nr:AraC family transcriptional regulator [Candidatus Methylacidiphilales bacterium]
MLTLRIRQRQPSLDSVGIGVEYYPDYINREINLHSLDVVLLTLILRGRGRHIIDDEAFAENGASLAVTHYGQRHDVLTDEKGMDILNVYLDLQHHPLPSLPHALQPVLPLFLPLHPRFQHRLNRIVRLQFDNPNEFAAPLFSIQRELTRQPAGFEEAVALHFKIFLIRCCRHALEHGVLPSRPDAPVSQPRIEELRQYLDQNFAEALTLENLAKRAGYSRTTLCRVFKTYTGKRLFDYLIERRIQAAMIRLRGNDDKIVNIALESGFGDLAYFNRKFRQIVGITPSMYRAGTTNSTISE